MPLTDDATILSLLNVRATDQPTLTRYKNLRRLAERAVISYLKWPVLGVVGSTDYYSGQGQSTLPLRYPFTSQVTAVYWDQTGAGGAGPNAFSNPALVNGQDYVLVPENNSAVGLGAVSKSSSLVRLSNNAVFFPSDLIFYRGAGGLGWRKGAFWAAGVSNIKVVSNWGFVNGVVVSSVSWSSGTATFTTTTPHNLWSGLQVTISGAVPSGWNDDWTVLGCPTSTTFTASAASNFGAITTNGSLSSVPLDIVGAVAEVVGIWRTTIKTGFPLSSESGGDYNYSLAISMDPNFTTVRQLLSMWRDVAIIGMG